MASRKRLTAAQTRELRKLIKVFLRAGGRNRPRFIAEYLNSNSQLRHPNGRPWDGAMVSSALGRKPVRQPRVVTTPKPESPVLATSSEESLQLAELVLASNMPSSKKEALLRSLFKVDANG